MRTLAKTGALVLAACCCGCYSFDRADSVSWRSRRDREIAAALLSGRPAAAREHIAEELRAKPKSGDLHLLSGLSYQLEGDSTESLNLARVGYEAAVRFAPGNYWSHYLAGAAALDLQDYPEAAGHFSRAIMEGPDRPDGFLGLAIAAYFGGDLPIAWAAADRARRLAPTDPRAIRAAAFVAAASGDPRLLGTIISTADRVPGAARELSLYRPRLDSVLRMVSGQRSLDQQGVPTVDQQPAAPAGPPDAPNQVMVDVTLLLNQAQSSSTTGINLLDGLAAQFGLEHQTTDTRVTGAPDSFSRVFTTALRVPQVTYSLNLFNTATNFYRVVARPSLVAYLDQPSEFFIGRTITVGVSGINLGQLQPIDVGTTVRVTPSEITPTRAKFYVNVTRSFLVADVGGSFAQSVTTFKQRVEATADVEFGKTLILSGLYEAVDFGSASKTPGLGDVPGVALLFNARNRSDRRDVALVLVTPRLVASLDTGRREFRGDAVRRLLDLWNTVVDPSSDLDAITGAIRPLVKDSTIFAPNPGDLRLRPTTDPATLNAVVAETLAQLR